MKSMSSAARTPHISSIGRATVCLRLICLRTPPGTCRPRRSTCAAVFGMASPIGYNTKLVKPEDAPKSFADLLDPRWQGRIVKGNPNYSGAILTATFQIARDLGWSYFEKLARQKVIQVQSALDPPKKLALGESAVQADGLSSSLRLL